MEPATCDAALAAQWVTLTCEGLTMQLKDDESDFSLNFNATACDWGICALPDCPVRGRPRRTRARLPRRRSRCPRVVLRMRCDTRGVVYAYYACREVDADCGPDGYLMRYAHHYLNVSVW